MLLPYRDLAATIEEALDSLLGQRGVELTVVAIDDGSRDDGPACVARLAARHRQLQAISAGGVGLPQALGLGLAAATGDLIARCDGDDVCHPERLARQLARLAERPQIAVLGCAVEPFPEAAVGDGLRRYVDWQNRLLTAADHHHQIFVEAPLCHPSVVIRRQALTAVGPWRDGPWPEDYDLWLRLDAAGYELAKLPEPLLRWRHRPGRVTFSDPRCALHRLRELKAPFLASRLRRLGRPFAVWGAGPTGRRLARALEAHGPGPRRFIDVDPGKIGRSARGVPVVGPEGLAAGVEIVLIAVGTAGVRDRVRAFLDQRRFEEGRDYLAVA